MLHIKIVYLTHTAFPELGVIALAYLLFSCFGISGDDCFRTRSSLNTTTLTTWPPEGIEPTPGTLCNIKYASNNERFHHKRQPVNQYDERFQDHRPVSCFYST
jgi:hypothetical protein